MLIILGNRYFYVQQDNTRAIFEAITFEARHQTRHFYSSGIVEW